jgi:hypothetical protein
MHLASLDSVLNTEIRCAICDASCGCVFNAAVRVLTRSVLIVVRCHGEEDCIEISEESLVFNPILAFRKQRDEIDRLAAEDAAIAALGCRDPEEDRFEAEDAALEALGL